MHTHTHGTKLAVWKEQKRIKQLGCEPSGSYNSKFHRLVSNSNQNGFMG